MAKIDIKPDYLDFFVKFLNNHYEYILTYPNDTASLIQFCQEFVSSFQEKFGLTIGGKITLYNILLLKSRELEKRTKRFYDFTKGQAYKGILIYLHATLLVWMDEEHIGDGNVVNELVNKCLDKIQKYSRVDELEEKPNKSPPPETDEELFQSKTMLLFCFYRMFMNDYVAVPFSHRLLSNLQFSSCKRLLLIFASTHNLNDIADLAERLDKQNAREIFLDTSPTVHRCSN
jgi:hypothetical protein